MPSRTYVLGLNVIAESDSNGITYLLHDGHGSTRLLMGTSNTTPIERYDYDAFGGVIGFNSSTAKTQWLFAGDGINDLVTGWRQTDNRAINGFWFTSRDNIDISPGDFSNANLYLYVGGNPMNSNDPTGHYDEMFHFYTIAYLMLARGWTDDIAFSTAQWSQWVDEDPVTNPTYLCARHRFDMLRDYHFPGSSLTTKTARNDAPTRAHLIEAFGPYQNSGIPSEENEILAGRR